MVTLAPETERLVAKIDAAIEAHLEWTRRVLRCAALHASPGDDVLADDAHWRCRFAHWLEKERQTLKAVDAAATARIREQHEGMHAAVRRLCHDLLARGVASEADLDAFESAQKALVAELASLKTRIVAHAARHDPLTGLPLWHGLEEEFGRHRALAQRGGARLAIVMADVDHFKRINDCYGHAVGDAALRHVADILRATVRASDRVFRFGGEEFLLLLLVADAQAAARTVRRILRAFRNNPARLEGGLALELRISAGVALCEPGESMAEVLERADRALYAAKRAGRDRWLWAGRGPEHPGAGEAADAIPSSGS
jgi:diguanylate cyclase (GGDEF)-like protein